jgi:ribosome maturation factor RimP
MPRAQHQRRAEPEHDPSREAEHGRHQSAVAVLERAVEPVAEDMGFELLLLEWLGSGKRRVLRVFLDHPDGVSVADCSRMSRIIGNALDAASAAAKSAETDADADAEGQGEPVAEVDPALVALLDRPYTLEVSSPGVDRPLTRRRHFVAHVGGRVRIELWSALTLDEGALEGQEERKFQGRLVAVEEDPEAPEDQRRGVVVVHDDERKRTIRVAMPRIRRANLVWEF